MIRGWYTGASGMNAQQNRLDAISNNLANVDTAGYKRDVTVSKSFSELLLRRTNLDGVYKTPVGSADSMPIIGKLGLGVETNENYTDFAQGSYRETGSNIDFAFGGKGFFAV
ncbi:MAG: flagellar hook-basal body complex protein, partial [Treponema sp.]|nr:flagellar hook-basal body complex protein [Treponema sp.]